GGDLSRLGPDDLFEFDQDHYGGLKAVDELARRAGITAASRVLDVCAGLAGPARFLASRRGCRVLALELHAGRAAGGVRLKRLVEWMAATTLQSLDSYRALLGRAGFVRVEAEDLSDEWRPLVKARLATFRALRGDLAARLPETRARDYEQLYAFFVGLLEDGKLGGGRLSGSA